MSPEPPVRPSFGEALRFWLKLGFVSFGGPAGQIALMHREVVERRRWVDEAHFLHALNFCLLLPGPEAQQLATYLGWLLHRTRGALAAGALFVLPAALLLWGLSWLYLAGGNLWWVRGTFAGLQPAVVAIVLAAVIRLGTKALRHPIHWVLAVGALLALRLGAPFPLVVLTAGLVGWQGGRRWLDHLTRSAAAPTVAEAMPAPTLRRALRVSAVCLSLWWLPILAVGGWLGWESVAFRQGVFFSQAAMITFGGAYAVLPYVGQQAVEHYGWLSASQMLDGLGLAETTPGPLIMVLQFIGFVGGWQQPGAWSPLAAATLCAAVTTWATFAPSFYWIFLGAPYIERLRQHAGLRGAMAAISAAVVGVILNLGLWFGAQVLFPAGGADAITWAVTAVAWFGLQRLSWNVPAVVGGAALLGVLRAWVP